MRLAGAALAALLAAGCQPPEPPEAPDAGAAEGCGPASCAGCCSDGACVSGYVEAACGLQGARCEVCSSAQFCNRTRRCEDFPHDGGPIVPWGPSGPPPASPNDAGVAPSGEPMRRCYPIFRGWGWICT